MNNFEATVLISSETPKNDIEKIGENFENLIKNNNGTLIGKEDWGLKELAYKIKTLHKAFYFFYQINIEGSKIQNLKKSIAQNEKIIRFLFIKVKNHEKLPTKMLEGDE